MNRLQTAYFMGADFLTRAQIKTVYSAVKSLYWPDSPHGVNSPNVTVEDAVILMCSLFGGSTTQAQRNYSRYVYLPKLSGQCKEPSEHIKKNFLYQKLSKVERLYEALLCILEEGVEPLELAEIIFYQNFPAVEITIHAHFEVYTFEFGLQEQTRPGVEKLVRIKQEKFLGIYKSIYPEYETAFELSKNDPDQFLINE